MKFEDYVSRPDQASLHVCKRYRHCKYTKRDFARLKRQRIAQGFCDADAFAVDDHLLRLIPAMIDHLADNTHTYPLNSTPEAWAKKLREIAENFRILQRLMDVTLEESGAQSYQELDDMITAAKDKAFDELKEHFFELWD